MISCPSPLVHSHPQHLNTSTPHNKMGKKSSRVRRNPKTTSDISTPAYDVKTIFFKDAEESEYREIMDMPHCNNVTCLEDSLHEKVTCECGFVHYCSNECKEEDMESHKQMCNSMRLKKTSEKVNVILNFMNTTGKAIPVLFNGHVCSEDNVLYGNCKFIFDSQVPEGHMLEYNGPLHYKTVKKKGSNKNFIVAQGVGKSTRKSDPRAKVKTKIHIGGYDYSLRNGWGKMYKDLKHCLLYTSPSPRDRQKSRMPSSA